MSVAWNNFSVGASGESGESGGPQAIGDELPACASCRKRKLRCSRETPICSQCERLSVLCEYTPKQKPGLRPGALEALTRRVAFLENILLDEAGSVRPRFDSQEQAVPQTRPEERAPIDTQRRHVSVSNLSHPEIPSEQQQSRKRKRNEVDLDIALNDTSFEDIAKYLPHQSLLLKVVDHFCITFHHWIPMVHKKRLRVSVCRGQWDSNLSLLLHSIVAATLRHLPQGSVSRDTDQILSQTRLSRSIVAHFAITDPSLESLRSLIITAFGYLNDGEAQKAWPLIGSLTRMVDYLQLTLEPSLSNSTALMNPLTLVSSTNDWTELEERRRLFWVVFLFDRFCSLSTGWNTSLTSEDVHRRLPADGGFFTREEPVSTPYFGIWNKAYARIGRSLAHVPAQYNEDDPATEQVQGTSPSSVTGPIDASKLGAFAYCIEATESLSQVTTFFLQQRINWQDKEHAISWLTRFKELDLRLVQWKMFLPPRWKDSDISSDHQVVDMDPNLTLAHITHNTSMILLHHPIAYPPKAWANYLALPKDCSAQTCEHAAIESANIVDKFLAHRAVFVNPQFAFCTFVAAKALLYQYQVKRHIIRPEFERLVRSLKEMSARWTISSHQQQDASQPETVESDQAGTYARHLECLRELCFHDRQFSFDFYDHSCRNPLQRGHNSTVRVDHNSTMRPNAHDATLRSQPGMLIGPQRPTTFPEAISSHAHRSTRSIDSDSLVSSDHQPQSESVQTMDVPIQLDIQASPIFVPQNQHAFSHATQFAPASNHVPAQDFGDQLQDENLLSLSDAFMDSRFLGLDRVITFEDVNFFMPGDGFHWQ